MFEPNDYLLIAVAPMLAFFMVLALFVGISAVLA